MCALRTLRVSMQKFFILSSGWLDLVAEEGCGKQHKVEFVHETYILLSRIEITTLIGAKIITSVIKLAGTLWIETS